MSKQKHTLCDDSLRASRLKQIHIRMYLHYLCLSVNDTEVKPDPYWIQTSEVHWFGANICRHTMATAALTAELWNDAYINAGQGSHTF